MTIETKVLAVHTGASSLTPSDRSRITAEELHVYLAVAIDNIQYTVDLIRPGFGKVTNPALLARLLSRLDAAERDLDEVARVLRVGPWE